MKIFVLLLVSMTFVSCGKIDELAHGGKTVYKLDPAQAEPYSYELLGKSCGTGEHEFNTFLAVCQALTDNNLNNNCAEVEREELFLSAECSGSFR